MESILDMIANHAAVPMGRDERGDLMVGGRRTGEDSASLSELVDARADATPNHLLLVDEDGRRVTCGEFREASCRLAAQLGASGIDAGTVVSWILPTRIDTVLVMAALSRLGAVQNPIVPIYRAREIGHILDEACVDAIVITPEWRGVDYLDIVNGLAHERAGRPIIFTLEDVMRGSLPPEVDIHAELHENLGESKWLFYTSGSTGLPKGVRHTDATLCSVARGMAEHLTMTGSDRNGIAFPIAHVGGSINLMASLVSGTPLILIETFEPMTSSAVLAREGVTMAGSGTAFHVGYLEVQRTQPTRPLFPTLRCCPGGGAPKPPELHERVRRELGGLGIISGWGLTEAPVLTMGRPTDPDVKLSETEGRPLPGVELRVVSPDEDVLAPGEPGELRARAPQMMLGYVNASLDAAAFDDEGYLRTGDLGRIDADGYVRITGRLKDVVIRNGENIGTAEVEELLRRHPSVTDLAVIGLPDERTGERVCAVLELAPGSTGLDVRSVGAYLGGLGLRRQAWPEQVEVVDRVPRTVAGKIEKVELKASFFLDRSPQGASTYDAVGATGPGGAPT
jgi:cyclohexanecarboxylate-CoA ligase